MPKAVVFTAVVRAGSFSAAADMLGVARSTVSQQINALETALSTQLLVRSTRSMRLTEEGQLLYDRMSEALQAWEDAHRSLVDGLSEPMGTIRVTAPRGLTRVLIAQAAGTLLRRYPQVRLDLNISDRILDVIGEGVDLAIRMAALEDSALVSKRLGQSYEILVARADMVVGDDVARAIVDRGFVMHAGVTPNPLILWDGDRELNVSVTSRASTNTTEGLMELAEAGAGIALCPEVFAREAMAAGRLVRVFPQLRGREVPLFAVYPSRRMPERVSRFLQLLELQLRTVLGSTELGL